MKNNGKSQHRMKDNELEKTFAEEWEKLNTDRNGKLNGMGTLDYLLAETINYPSGEVTDRDRVVAATVVQWLGSPVGSEFVKRVVGA